MDTSSSLRRACSLFPAHRPVLVLEHTPDGAMGVVLGRELRDARGGGRAALAELAVYLGGPVAPEAVVALGDFGHPAEASTRVVGSLGTLDPDSPSNN